jgi:peptidoglycan L-alanyl-D-glutamate endopeptidase CwlK
MSYKLSNRSLDRLSGVKPVLIYILEEAIKTSPYDFGIPSMGGKRTPEDQNYLFKSGKSKCDGYNKKSNHQSGNAFDIFLYIDGKASWNRDKLQEVAHHLQTIAKDCFSTNLRWGADWDRDGIRVDKDKDESFFDGAHFEISTKAVTIIDKD